MQTDANAFVLPPTSPLPISTSPKRRKSFYTQEEEIEIKPSTELIPDEYEHAANNDVLLHIFRSTLDVDHAEDLVETLEKIDYRIDHEKNVHELNSREEFLTDLENIKRSSFEKSALLLVFVGFFDINSEYESLLMMREKTSVPIKQIWNLFTANNCPELKNKPKMFIFCTSPKPPDSEIQTDSVRHYTVESEHVYDFPDESDILIVYKQINDPFTSQKARFVTQLCENIITYSKKYDIVDLVSYFHDNIKSVPIIVSTLTRKFYLTPNSDREHYLSLIENYNSLEETLQKLQDDLEKLTKIQKKKKDKKFTFSFRKKDDEKPKIVKKDDQSKNVKTDSPGNSKTSVPTSSSPRTKLSAGPAVGKRSKQPFESDGSNENHKPIWKI